MNRNGATVRPNPARKPDRLFKALALLASWPALSVAAPGFAQNGVPSNASFSAPAAPDTPPPGAGCVSAPGRERDDDDLVHVGLQADHRRPLNGAYAYTTQGNLVARMNCGEHDSMGLFFGGGVFELKAGSVTDAIAHQPFFGEFGFVGCHYFTPPHAFLRPYITGGAAGVLMGWQYRSAVPTQDGAVWSDRVCGVDGFAGAGISAGLREHWHIFCEAGAGCMGLPAVTQAELRNTLFDSFGYVSVRAGLSLAF